MIVFDTCTNGEFGLVPLSGTAILGHRIDGKFHLLHVAVAFSIGFL
jgi:hypothetical protein